MTLTMPKRALLATLVVVMFASWWIAAQPAPAATELTHFTYNGHGDEWRTFLRTMAEPFEAETGISVSVVNSGSNADWRPRLLAMIAGGVPPDVTDGHPAISGAFIAEGAFENLAPYIERDGVPIDQMPPAALQGSRMPDGGYWSIPASIYPMVTFFNADMFSAIGLQNPEELGDDWNWDVFMASARRFTRDLDGDGNTDQYGTYRLHWRWDMQVHQAGGAVYDRFFFPSQSRWDTPEVLEAIRFLHELMAVHGVDALNSSYSLWNHRAGMSIAYGPGVIETYLRDVSFEWGMAMQPVGAVSRAARVNPDGFQILSSSSNKEAAWRWIRYLVADPDHQVELARITARMPSLREAMLRYPEVVPRLPDNWTVFVDTAFDPASYSPYVLQSAELDAFVSQTLMRVWTGALAPDTAVAQIHQQAVTRLSP